MAKKGKMDIVKWISGLRARWLASRLNYPDKEENAVSKLINLGDAAVPALIRKLRDKNPEVRRNVLWLLEDTWNAKTMPVLIELLKDADKGVRQEAVGSLEKLAPLVDIYLPHIESTLKQFVAGVRERGNAAKSLESAKWAASTYARIAEAVKKAKQAEMGGELLKEKPRPPKGRMYRKLRKAMA